jgi:hypothetical protein
VEHPRAVVGDLLHMFLRFGGRYEHSAYSFAASGLSTSSIPRLAASTLRERWESAEQLLRVSSRIRNQGPDAHPKECRTSTNTGSDRLCCIGSCRCSRATVLAC